VHYDAAYACTAAVVQKLLLEKNTWASVEVVVDRGERVVFKEKFADFTEGMDTSVKPEGNVQRKDKTPYVTGAGMR
jgi:hypothetical protein